MTSLSYVGIMEEIARQRGLRRWIVRVPFLSLSLSSRWLTLITPVYASIGRYTPAGWSTWRRPCWRSWARRRTRGRRAERHGPAPTRCCGDRTGWRSRISSTDGPARPRRRVPVRRLQPQRAVRRWPRGEAPNVARLIEMGTAFEHGAMSSLPTVTLANHTSILTGRLPRPPRHPAQRVVRPRDAASR